MFRHSVIGYVIERKHDVNIKGILVRLIFFSSWFTLMEVSSLWEQVFSSKKVCFGHWMLT